MMTGDRVSLPYWQGQGLHHSEHQHSSEAFLDNVQPEVLLLHLLIENVGQRRSPDLATVRSATQPPLLTTAGGVVINKVNMTQAPRKRWERQVVPLHSISTQKTGVRLKFQGSGIEK